MYLLSDVDYVNGSSYIDESLKLSLKICLVVSSWHEGHLVKRSIVD